MVLTIENLAATAGPGEHPRIDRKVLDAMRKVPRHLLVPEEVRADAYRNIGRCRSATSRPSRSPTSSR
jgi:protein-L-isoaspartate O-methyltransferase